MSVFSYQYIKSIYIRCHSVIVIAFVFSKVLLTQCLHRMSRQRADAYTREFAQRVLAVIKLKIDTVFHAPLQFQPGRCYILMSNHSSLYDIPIIFSSLPGSIRMLAKKELRRIPIFGFILAKNDFIFINRKKPSDALDDLAIATQKMQNGIVLWVSPEGTRTTSDQLLPFKRGVFRLALETNAIIIPIGIRGARQVLPKHTWNFSTHRSVSVHVGASIDTKDYQKETLPELLHLTQERIGNLAYPCEEIYQDQ